MYECPICGAKTEVYSRITGYYRPVQNWNDGKSKEFKDRKVYDVSRSVLKRVSDAGEAQEIVNIDAVSTDVPDTVLLFTTQTCPNCKIAETFLQKANVPYQKVVAEENASLVQQYSIMKAPTLIVQHDGHITKYDNASDIRRYSDSVTK